MLSEDIILRINMIDIFDYINMRKMGCGSMRAFDGVKHLHLPNGQTFWSFIKTINPDYFADCEPSMKTLEKIEQRLKTK